MAERELHLKLMHDERLVTLTQEGWHSASHEIRTLREYLDAIVGCEECGGKGQNIEWWEPGPGTTERWVICGFCTPYRDAWRKARKT